MRKLREGVKKNLEVTDQSVNGGGTNPLAVTKIGVFFTEKEKKMQNVLKRKKYANIFCNFFARVSVKKLQYFMKISGKMFSLITKVFFFHKNISFNF